MKYSFNKTIYGKSFDEAIVYVTEMLKTEGFGIISEIDIQKALKEKINVDFRRYRILGACNPHFAHKSLSIEDKIGVFLPCNVVVQELASGDIEIMAVDPVAMMSPVDNDALSSLSSEVQSKLRNVIDKL